MNDHIDTSDGTWREVNEAQWAGITDDSLRVVTDGELHYWVRTAPVPPLPTAHYTVIRVTSTSGMESILIRNELGWYEIDDMSAPVEQPITGWYFQVLSEPRAVTAKAVLPLIDEVCRDDLSDYYGEVRLKMHDRIAREFGVES